MNQCCGGNPTDHGPELYVTNIPREAVQNRNFRKAIWTGEHLQMTLMSIPPYGEIGMEMHSDTDQVIRVEQGRAVVKFGKCCKHTDSQQPMGPGDAVFVPAGTWHNVVNAGRTPLKLSSVYAPPHHPRGTVHATKEVAEHREKQSNYSE